MGGWLLGALRALSCRGCKALQRAPESRTSKLRAAGAGMTSTEPSQPSAAPSDGTGALVTLRSYIMAIRSHPSVCRVAEHPWLIKCIDAWAIEKNRLAAARGLISLYFFNVWFTSLQMWWWGRQRFPLIWIFLVLPAVCLVIDWRIKLVAWVLMAEVLKDSVELLLQVLQTFFIRGVWYLNELMVKKLSMLGCTFLVLLMAHGKAKNPLAGLLMEGALLIRCVKLAMQISITTGLQS